jgi:hypothetical protein
LSKGDASIDLADVGLEFFAVAGLEAAGLIGLGGAFAPDEEAVGGGFSLRNAVESGVAIVIETDNALGRGIDEIDSTVVRRTAFAIGDPAEFALIVALHHGRAAHRCPVGTRVSYTAESGR